MKPKTVGRSGGAVAVKPAMDSTGLSGDSIILTLDGERRVADLQVGDRVITRDRGMALLTGISHRSERTRAVRIRAGSLGHTRPTRDVTLPAGQLILVRDWRAQAIFGARQAMVPVARLVDGEYVTLLPEREIELYDLGFERAHVLYVDGLEVANGPALALAGAPG